MVLTVSNAWMILNLTMTFTQPGHPSVNLTTDYNTLWTDCCSLAHSNKLHNKKMVKKRMEETKTNYWLKIPNYQKLVLGIMQFKSFHWLSHHGSWAIKLDKLNGKYILYILAVTISLFLQNKVCKIYLYFGAFLINQLFHYQLLDMRWF